MNLMTLLQSVGADIAPEEDTIEVMGARPRPQAVRPNYNEAPEREAIDPRYILSDDRIAPNADEMDEIVPRKGMFGVKGTLRDVLGLLGDTLLVGGGDNAIYAPRRAQEREGDALFGFTQNPLQAIERLAAENPDAAAKLWTQFQQAEQAKAVFQGQQAGRESQINDRNFDNREKGLNRVSRWVAGGLPYEQIIKGAAQYNITAEELAELGVGPNMTPEQRQQFAAGDMTVNQQVQVPYTERRVLTGEKNADTARINATRPRAAPQPRQRTLSGVDAEVADAVLNGTATPAQKKYYDERLTRGKKSGGRINAAPPPPAAAGKKPASRFRIIN